MKRIGEPETRRGANAWGQSSVSIHTPYEVEEADVGRKRPDYKGHKHTEYTFKKSDVGRTVDVLTDGTGWTCWVFLT